MTIHLNFLPSNKDNMRARVFTANWQGQSIQFKENKVPGQGDCGFEVLNISRQDLVNAVLRRSHNASVRQRFASEIKEALITNRVDPNIAPGWQKLYADLVKKQSNLNALKIELEVKYPNLKNMNMEQELGWLKENQNKYYISLVQARHKYQQAELTLQNYDYSNPELFNKYINYYNKDLWLSCEGILFYAEYILNESIYIWKEQASGTITLEAQYIALNNNSSDNHIIYTGHYTHYNKLEIIKSGTIETNNNVKQDSLLLKIPEAILKLVTDLLDETSIQKLSMTSKFWLIFCRYYYSSILKLERPSQANFFIKQFDKPCASDFFLFENTFAEEFRSIIPFLKNIEPGQQNRLKIYLNLTNAEKFYYIGLIDSPTQIILTNLIENDAIGGIIRNSYIKFLLFQTTFLPTKFNNINCFKIVTKLFLFLQTSSSIPDALMMQGTILKVIENLLQNRNFDQNDLSIKKNINHFAEMLNNFYNKTIEDEKSAPEHLQAICLRISLIFFEYKSFTLLTENPSNPSIYCSKFFLKNYIQTKDFNNDPLILLNKFITHTKSMEPEDKFFDRNLYEFLINLEELIIETSISNDFKRIIIDNFYLPNYLSTYVFRTQIPTEKNHQMLLNSIEKKDSNVLFFFKKYFSKFLPRLQISQIFPTLFSLISSETEFHKFYHTDISYLEPYLKIINDQLPLAQRIEILSKINSLLTSLIKEDKSFYYSENTRHLLYFLTIFLYNFAITDEMSKNILDLFKTIHLINESTKSKKDNIFNQGLKIIPGYRTYLTPNHFSKQILHNSNLLLALLQFHLILANQYGKDIELSIETYQDQSSTNSASSSSEPTNTIFPFFYLINFKKVSPTSMINYLNFIQNDKALSSNFIKFYSEQWSEIGSLSDIIPVTLKIIKNEEKLNTDMTEKVINVLYHYTRPGNSLTTIESDNIIQFINSILASQTQYSHYCYANCYLILYNLLETKKYDFAYLQPIFFNDKLKPYLGMQEEILIFLNSDNFLEWQEAILKNKTSFFYGISVSFCLKGTFKFSQLSATLDLLLPADTTDTKIKEIINALNSLTEHFDSSVALEIYNKIFPFFKNLITKNNYTTTFFHFDYFLLFSQLADNLNKTQLEEIFSCFIMTKFSKYLTKNRNLITIDSNWLILGRFLEKILLPLMPEKFTQLLEFLSALLNSQFLIFQYFTVDNCSFLSNIVKKIAPSLNSDQLNNLLVVYLKFTYQFSLKANDGRNIKEMFHHLSEAVQILAMALYKLEPNLEKFSFLQEYCFISPPDQLLQSIKKGNTFP